MTETHDCSYRSPLRRHDRRFFYKYVSAAVAKIILKNRSLRWSSPLLFNDPFDVTQELRLNFDAAELSAAFAEEFAALIEEDDHSAIPRHPGLRVFLSVLNRLPNPDLRRKIAEELRREPSATTAGQLQAFATLKQWWREFVPTLRILCLSELKDVTSMWLHYADSYRGAVLEFECIDQLDSASLVARPMIYQDTLPAIASKQVWARCMLGRAEKTYYDLFTEYEYVKTTAWSYEREWRIVTLARPGESGLFFDYPFNPCELTGIYLGTCCSDEDQSDIVSLLTHGLEHVSAYRAHVDGVGAKFIFQGIR